MPRDHVVYARKPCASCDVPFTPTCSASKFCPDCRPQRPVAVRAVPKRGGIATSEPDYSDDEREFQMAVDRYKRAARRPFPALSEILAVLKSLGYRKAEKS